MNTFAIQLLQSQSENAGQVQVKNQGSGHGKGSARFQSRLLRRSPWKALGSFPRQPLRFKLESEFSQIMVSVPVTIGSIHECQFGS
eukprot:4139242-Pleurochrysis_carterae.AAC.1